MSYDHRHPPAPTIVKENPEFTAWVERRAVDLCTDPEAHHPPVQARPCFTHLQMARREGLDAWKARQP